MKQLYIFIFCYLTVSLCYSQDDYDPNVYDAPNICRSPEIRLDSVVAIDLSLDSTMMDTIFEFDYIEIYSYAWDNPLLPETVDYTAAGDRPERYSYSYDDDGNLLTIKVELYDDLGMVWRLQSERENNYDENASLILWERTDYDIFSGEIFFKVKEERVYDDMGNLSEYDKYIWDSALEEYYLSTHADFYYNDFNVTDSIQFFRWDRVDEVLDPWFQYLYTSEEDRLLTREQISWDDFTQSFIPFARREWTYDSDGFQTSLTFERYINEEWQFTTRYEYEIDDCGNILVWTLYAYDADTEEWVIRGINTYYYSGLSDTKEVIELSAALYPNPSSNFVTISNINLKEEFQISIVNLSGMTLSVQTVTQGTPVDISYLPSGIYNINILSDDKYYSARLSKL